MGLLDKLRKRKGPEVADRIWPTVEAKVRDLETQVRDHLDQGALPVVVTHFPDTLRELAGRFGTAEGGAVVLSSAAQFPGSGPDLIRHRGRIVLLASEAIPTTVDRFEAPPREDPALPPIAIHLAEHYPLPDRDQRVFGLAGYWPNVRGLACYTSLDEPWLAPFGVERVRSLLPMLGAGEDDMISSPIVTRTLAAAQAKLAKRVPRDQPCANADEWMRRHLPDGV